VATLRCAIHGFRVSGRGLDGGGEGWGGGGGWEG